MSQDISRTAVHMSSLERCISSPKIPTCRDKRNHTTLASVTPSPAVYPLEEAYVDRYSELLLLPRPESPSIRLDSACSASIDTSAVTFALLSEETWDILDSKELIWFSRWRSLALW